MPFKSKATIKREAGKQLFPNCLNQWGCFTEIIVQETFKHVVCCSPGNVIEAKYLCCFVRFLIKKKKETKKTPKKLATCCVRTR